VTQVRESEPRMAAPDALENWLSIADVHRNAGRSAEAANYYAFGVNTANRELAWHARLQLARCLLAMGNEGAFLEQALEAWNLQPERAEPLYDLARFYRERGMYDASVLFCEAGLALPPPPDTAFRVESFVYGAGLMEEYSIAANYASDPLRKGRGHAACDWLALSRETLPGPRELARNNLYYYAPAAATIMPSFSPTQIAFSTPPGYRATNPSISVWSDRLFVLVRTVNYGLREDGTYYSLDGARYRTRNFLLALDDGTLVTKSHEILPPSDLPEPQYRDEAAFGDVRLFAWRDALWGLACYRELTSQGWCEQVLARIDNSSADHCRLADWRVLRPGPPKRHEKNWMPVSTGDKLRFIYLCDPTTVLDDDAHRISDSTPAIAAEQFRGGSQAIPFDGGWLAVIHEVLWRNGRRYYLHRFVWFDAFMILRRVSRSFFFIQKSVEFVAGLARHPKSDTLIVSFGVNDSEAWLATISSLDVRHNLRDLRSAQRTQP